MEHGKISVSKEGLYYIDSSEISSLLGISQDTVKQRIKTGLLALSSQGSRIAYIPSDDYSGLFFYGEGIHSVYTKENIYWLYNGYGLPMASVEGDGPATAGPATFTETVHAEEDATFLTTRHGPESDYWFWSYHFVSRHTQPSPVKHSPSRRTV
jgi:hypothetical protein